MNEKYTITVRFFSHLKDKAGIKELNLVIEPNTSIFDLKKKLTDEYPALETHLDNILVMIGNKVGINEDQIPDKSTISFMTPIGGG